MTEVSELEVMPGRAERERWTYTCLDDKVHQLH